MTLLRAASDSIIDPWIPLWISVGAAFAALVALVFFASQARSAYRSRPDKGTVRLQLVGTNGHGNLYADEWVVQNAGTGTAINPRVKFTVLASWMNSSENEHTAWAAGLVGPLGSLRLFPSTNWPSPSTLDGNRMLWEGLTGTVYWHEPGRRRERKRKIEVFVDPTSRGVADRSV